MIAHLTTRNNMGTAETSRTNFGAKALTSQVNAHVREGEGDMMKLATPAENFAQQCLQRWSGHLAAGCGGRRTEAELQLARPAPALQVGLRCRLVAVLLHYFFLAAFCWMSLEGVELYFLVVRVFQGQGLSKWQLCLIGYGVSLLIVGISAAVNSEGYGRTLYCWLNPARGFLWSFLGPVTFIVLCNAVVFVTTVWKLTQKFSEINPDMKKLKKARVLTVTAVAQLFVLGSTWVFGLFLFNPQSWLLSYTFTILNCLQGLFLFVLHCLLNKKVREEYRRWAGRVTANRYSEFTTSTSGTSHNQTQAHRPSESGM
ncbi:CD97 antigen-like [Leptonychotes weddellii]|uniref:CD97 antigen-like n=1 Tax=Leptonychotes weddellii TaxID=9713 RepID=A0A7F8QI88_LEPWE|nr:CD97 antigen-like [Leptonychotes weddellii]